MTTDLNNELTALNEAARAARLLANISRRAQTLFTDGGYQCRAYGDNQHVVESPKGDKYSVWHGEETGYSCSCPCFARLNTCKHLEAVDLMKQEAAQLKRAEEEAEWEAYEKEAGYRYEAGVYAW